MPTLDDLPTLSVVSPTGDDLLPIYDVTAGGSSKVRKLALNQIVGLSASDIGTAITTDAQTISSRLTVFSGRTAATAATLPAASGALRSVIIVNTNTSLGVVTVSGGGGVTGNAAIPVPASGVSSSAQFLSDGTSWYRVS